MENETNKKQEVVPILPTQEVKVPESPKQEIPQQVIPAIQEVQKVEPVTVQPKEVAELPKEVPVVFLQVSTSSLAEENKKLREQLSELQAKLEIALNPPPKKTRKPKTSTIANLVFTPGNVWSARIEKKSLQKFLAVAKSCLVEKGISPLLENVRFQVEPSHVSIHFTTTKFTGYFILPCSCLDVRTSTESSILIHLKTLEKVVRSTTGEIGLEEIREGDKRFLQVVSEGKAPFKLEEEYKAKDFPALENVVSSIVYETRVGCLAEILKREKSSLCESNPRYDLDCLACYPHEAGVTLVSSDAKRIAKYELKIPGGKIPEVKEGRGIPLQSFGRLQKCLDLFPENEDIYISFGTIFGKEKVTQVSGKSGKIWIEEKQDFKFPPWEKIIPLPENNKIKSSLPPTGRIQEAVKDILTEWESLGNNIPEGTYTNTSILSFEKVQECVYNLVVKGFSHEHKIRVSVNEAYPTLFHPEDGSELVVKETKEQVIEGWKKKYNAFFLQDALGVLNSNQSVILTIGNDHLIIQDEDENFLYLVLPVREN